MKKDGLAICARCGTFDELCDSVRTKGIKQPRFCKKCVILSMETGDESYIEEYWLLQIKQLKDKETIDNIRKDRT